MIKVGEIYETNNYGTLEVIRYINSKKVRVRFVETGYERYTQAGDIYRGVVKDPLSPSVCGVGYLGVGDYVTKIKGEHTKEYQTWNNMLKRCYADTSLKRYPSYAGCTVSRGRHNFQVFATWFTDNYLDGYPLDKDIKIPGNKVYGPDTCMFVTPEENVEAAMAVTAVFRSPTGERHEVYNVAQFSREQGLHKGHLIGVKNGKRKTHKGWTKWSD